VPFVKGVGSFADDVRAHGHAFTSFGVRPFFGRFDSFGAGAVAALTVGHDQSIYFRAPRDFQKRSDAHVNPTDDEFVHFGEEDGMLRRLELCEPCFLFPALLRDSRVRRLVRRFEPRRSFLPAVALTSVRPFSWVLALFPRSLSCTASPFNSLRASAAIQRGGTRSPFASCVPQS